jgi:hypothetical protein
MAEGKINLRTVAIFSDSHDQIPNLKKALEFCQKNGIDTIIHCGDLEKAETLIEAWPNDFKATIHFCWGNADKTDEIIKKQKIFTQLKIYGQIGNIFLENKNIAFTHRIEKAKKLAETQKYDYIFYGHSHKPWAEKIGKTHLINPGDLSGFIYQPSFAILDLEKNKFFLKILNRI